MDRSLITGLGFIGVVIVADGCAQKTADCVALNNCVALEESASESGEGSEESSEEGSEEGPGDPQLPVNKDIDILFVIDNSGSMGEEQALLAANVGAFIHVLEADEVDANYRIGITTTDNGNPWCPPGSTTPEAGKLVLSSCKTRLGDFVFNNDVDAQDLACNNICSLDEADLEILPTTTDVDPNPAPRPWLEHIEGKRNIPATTDTAEAFACFGPQGINGCGFESQLESMYLALVRAQVSSEASYGFIRDSAILAVVFVTDEEDCSYNPDWSTIFDADGDKVFWSDPSAAFPTSALCWNAGVECFGDPSAYDFCDPVDKDINGNVTDDPANAVLYSMTRYLEFIQELQDQKQALAPDNEIIVALIGGVNSDGQPFYHDVGDSDPVFQDTFGIGPGCEAPNPLDPNDPVRAVPPVRIRALIDEFTPDNMFSICEPDYSPALEAIAERIRDQIQPACYTECVADTDPLTAVVDPACTLEENPPGPDNEVPIPECLRDANGYVIDPVADDYAMPNDAANVCYAILVDSSGQTTDPSDDMSPECIDLHYNLEFKLARRPGFPAAAGTAITATCELAESPEQQCPGIGAP